MRLPSAVSMAPRRDPRSSRNLPRDCPPRSRLTRLAADTDETFSEVPEYLVCPTAKTKRELMKRASILKAGVTGYGCPPGFSGVIVYPPTELENELLNSMGTHRAPEAGIVVGADLMIGQPLQEEAVVQEGEAPVVDGAAGVLMGQPQHEFEVVVQEGGVL